MSNPGVVLVLFLFLFGDRVGITRQETVVLFISMCIAEFVVSFLRNLVQALLEDRAMKIVEKAERAEKEKREKNDN